MGLIAILLYNAFEASVPLLMKIIKFRNKNETKYNTPLAAKSRIKKWLKIIYKYTNV